MKVSAYKTKKIQPGDSLYHILDEYLPQLEEKSIVAIASKIVGICEGRVVNLVSEDQKDRLVKEEAEFYLPKECNQYGFMLTINENILVASGGIDESNGNGNLVLWPKNPQKSINGIRKYLTQKHKLTYLGVIMTDSKLTPLRWGVTGVAIAHSGFEAINSYVGKPDIFGRKMRVEKANVADALAIAAVAEMGEGDEQTPLAVIANAKFVHFQDRNPTREEIDALKIDMKNDIYSTLLTSVKWEKRCSR